MSKDEIVNRRLMHTRRIVCEGFERADGLWEIEGHLSDTKTYDVNAPTGTAPRNAGEPVHLMSICLTVDGAMTIVAARALTVQAPYADCTLVNKQYEALVGVAIAPGFTAKVKKLFHGLNGCTHLTELLGPVATTAIQTMRTIIRAREAERGVTIHRQTDRALLDSCFALRSGGYAAVTRWGAEDDRLDER